MQTDGRGLPRGAAVDGANRHDMQRLDATLEAIMIERPKPAATQPQDLRLVKGGDDEKPAVHHGEAPPALILASASPRRRQLLAGSGVPFQVVPAAIDEQPLVAEPPDAYVRRLALAKAEAVARRYPGAFVLGADTTVTIDRLLLGKPQDVEEARQMLRRLSGRVHQVLTGVAVVQTGTTGGAAGRRLVEVTVSRVEMRPLTARTIAWYLASGEPMDKAGAYAVQGLGAALVERVEGSYTNVVGLPLSETLALLRQAGLIEEG
jgi:septum formation protein